MKKNTLQQQIKSTVMAGLAVSCLWNFTQPVRASDEVEDVEIENFSFEFHNGGNTSNGEFVLNSVIDGWTPYGLQATQFGRVGTLFADIAGSTWFNDTPAGATPDGNRVLILFTSNPNGGDPYGVEKDLAVIEGGCRYTLEVDVGNIASGEDTLGNDYNLDGFPIYRIQLFAGDMEVPLEQDFASLDIPEGEWATSTLIVDIPDDSPFIGQQLRVRLQNENNALLMGENNAIEVDFDNVRLTTEPIDTVNYWHPRTSVENIALATSSYDDPDVLEIDFDIENGETSLMVIGTSHSMNTTVANLAMDPAIRIIDRVTGEVVVLNVVATGADEPAVSDNWGAEGIEPVESQSGSIIDVVDSLVYGGNHNLLSTKSPLDAGRILHNIPVGQYTAQLISQNEDGVYAGLKIFAFPNYAAQTGNIAFPSLAQLEIEEMLKPEPEFKIEEPKEKEPTRKTPTRKTRVFSSKTALKK